jgi:hypothetical protein
MVEVRASQLTACLLVVQAAWKAGSWDGLRVNDRGASFHGCFHAAMGSARLGDARSAEETLQRARGAVVTDLVASLGQEVAVDLRPSVMRLWVSARPPAGRCCHHATAASHSKCHTMQTRDSLVEQHDVLIPSLLCLWYQMVSTSSRLLSTRGVASSRRDPSTSGGDLDATPLPRSGSQCWETVLGTLQAVASSRDGSAADSSTVATWWCDTPSCAACHV